MTQHDKAKPSVELTETEMELVAGGGDKAGLFALGTATAFVAGPSLGSKVKGS